MPTANLPTNPPGKSFGDLLIAEIPALRRYARERARGNKERADDLLQSVLARALAKQHLWQPGTNLRFWLFTIMHNQYVNEVRRSIREGVAAGEGVVDSIPDYRINPEIQTSIVKDLTAAMMKLPMDQRRTIVLVGYHGMSYEEAAEYEQVPVGTIRSRLSRGRLELSRLMGDPGAALDDEERALVERWGRKS